MGTKLAAFTLSDQHDKEHKVDEGTRLLLFSRDKDVAKMAFKVLEKKDASFLADRNARFLLDISAMPRVITWAFGKPKMRKHPFPLLLDTGPGPTKDLPAQEKKLTLVYLDQLKVERIVYVANEEELGKELDALAKP
ncbi:MAG: hypothetical protein QM765_13905 [Myxococcales bacterium]